MATPAEKREIYNLRAAGFKPEHVESVFPHIPPDELERIYKEEEARQRQGKHLQDDEGIAFSAWEDDATLTASGITRRVIPTLAALLVAVEANLDVWEVADWQATTWGQNSNQDGYVTLYRVFARFRPNGRARTEDLIADLRREIRHEAPAHEPPPIMVGKERRALECSIPDLHFGKQSWNEATGQHYDMDTAEALFLDAIERMLRIGIQHEVERFILPLGNDLFHVDSSDGTTRRGTPVHPVGSHRQHFKRVRRLAQKGILRLHEVAPVTAIMVPGNHDGDTVYMLGDALEDRFWNTDTVEIDASPRPRKYLQYGVNMIMWTHGAKIKPDKIPLLMATEEAQMWAAVEAEADEHGAAPFREAHLGHLHTKKEWKYMPVDEVNGVRVRVIPSLSAIDDWHYEQGFVRGIRAAEAYLWNYRSGMEAMFSIKAKSL